MNASLRVLELTEPFRIAHGVSSTRTVLRIEQDGHVAEAPFVPYYGEDPDETLAQIQRGVTSHALPRTARLAINLLAHDIATTHAGVPLSSVVREHTGTEPGRLPPGCRSIGIPEDLGSFEERVSRLSRQFGTLKLKLGSGDLGLDLALVEIARRAAPDAALILDVNGGWDPTEAPLMIEKITVYRPTLVEQPIHHRHPASAWQDLREALPESAPPLYADESVHTAEDLASLAPHIDGVNVKLLKCGSLEAACELIVRARATGLGVLLGCMVESSLGTTAAAHLAPWADWIDLDGHFYVANDDYEGIAYAEDGSLLLPDRPGIGARLR